MISVLESQRAARVGRHLGEQQPGANAAQAVGAGSQQEYEQAAAAQKPGGPAQGGR